MTESLFFSQIATKAIDAKKVVSAASAKLFRSDSGDFDKHLPVYDRGDRRGRERDNVTEFRREPTFSKKDTRHDSRETERASAPRSNDNTPEKRTEHSKESQENETAQTRDKEQPETKQSAEGKSDSATATNQQTGSSSQASSDEAGVEILTHQLLDASLEGENAALNTGESDEIALDTLVNLDEDSAHDTEQLSLEDTAQVIPLFGQTSGETGGETSENTTQPVAPGQTTAATEADLVANTAKKPTGQNPATPVLQAKQTNDGSRPGLENALSRLQAKKAAAATPATGEVTNASKDASMLANIDIEEAQKSGKTEIKARITELAQKTDTPTMSTAAANKPAAGLTQLPTIKTESLGPLQPVSSETVVTATQNNHTVHVRFGSLPQTTQSAQIPVTTIAFHIAKSIENGVNRFEIRIDPPELGRVDVRLEVGQTGRVIANLTVERPETLDLLQRDQRALERALEDAGLDVGGQSLNFSLRDQDANSAENGETGSTLPGAETAAEEEHIEPEMITGYVTPNGVDIRI